MSLQKNVVRFHGVVNRLRSLELMRSFDGLFLLINKELKICDGYGVPGKLYDYLATSNPIICDDASAHNLKDEFTLIQKNIGGGFQLVSIENEDCIIDSKIETVILSEKSDQTA
ncbi:MAG: hypothetical protein HOD92_12740 [Deltaproteobacteria bacterium]|jgi:hypothetical protein|nr:hypothetical protein [Deltaproteobacteria bacterium]